MRIFQIIAAAALLTAAATGARAQQPVDQAPMNPQLQSSSQQATEACIRLPRPEDQTDCLNKLSEEGRYYPMPVPAPTAQAPTDYQSPAGHRQLASPQ
jgi:hypothetical protein